MSVYKSSKELGVSANDSFWVDSRYNCIDCNFSLNRDDLVEVRGRVVKIVGVPKEIAQVNKKADKGRFLASVEEVEVPEKGFAVKGTDGITKIVKYDDISGKIFKEIPHFK